MQNEYGEEKINATHWTWKKSKLGEILALQRWIKASKQMICFSSNVEEKCNFFSVNIKKLLNVMLCRMDYSAHLLTWGIKPLKENLGCSSKKKKKE